MCLLMPDTAAAAAVASLSSLHEFAAQWSKQESSGSIRRSMTRNFRRTSSDLYSRGVEQVQLR